MSVLGTLQLRDVPGTRRSCGVFGVDLDVIVGEVAAPRRALTRASANLDVAAQVEFESKT